MDTSGMDKRDLKERTRHFAINIIKMVDALPKNRAGEIIYRQIVCSATTTFISSGHNTRQNRDRAKSSFKTMREYVETGYEI